MFKVLRYFMMAVMAFCFTVPAFSTAEAANVALLPLINNVAGNTTAGQVYAEKALNAIKAQKGFTLVENAKVKAAIKKYFVEGQLPNEGILKKIAEEGGADIVICMELNTLTDEKLVGQDDVLKLNLRGNTAAYNKITGAYLPNDFHNDAEIEEVFTSRWDWKSEEWGRTVTREVNKALQVKKVSLWAPKMSKL